MTSDSQASTLSALRDAGIVSPAHYQRALAHPQFDQLAAHTDPGDCLAWLVCSDIMSEDELKQAFTEMEARYTGDELERHRDTFVRAVQMVEGVRNLNRQHVDALVAETLITPEERDQALQHMTPENITTSPAAALAWMALAGVIDDKRLSAAAVRSASDGTTRAGILAEAGAIHARTRAAVKGAVLDAIFPGPRWLWIGVPVLVVAFMVWNAVRPRTVPSCTDSDVARTINNMMLRASIGARIDNPLQAMHQAPSTPTVKDIKEVGLASETGIRGCLAKLKIDEDEVPYAFTIAPTKGDKDNFIVTGAEPAIVQARFGHLDAKGGFLNKAEPIGRAELERAFRSGADNMNMGRPSYGPERNKNNPFSTSAPERTREIAEIEPLAPCREVKAGTVYSCRLLVERNDALLDAIGNGAGTLIDSEFTFERDGAAGPWRVSANFPEEYARAVTAARLKAVLPQQP